MKAFANAEHANQHTKNGAGVSRGHWWRAPPPLGSGQGSDNYKNAHYFRFDIQRRTGERREGGGGSDTPASGGDAGARCIAASAGVATDAFSSAATARPRFPLDARRARSASASAYPIPINSAFWTAVVVIVGVGVCGFREVAEYKLTKY